MEKWIGLSIISIVYFVIVLFLGSLLFPNIFVSNSWLYLVELVFTVIAAVGTVAASVMAFKANQVIKKQLEIEQEPFVVLDRGVIFLQDIKSNKICDKENKRDREENLKVKVKNIGRGPAIEISITSSRFIDNEALFESNQPHSINLFSTETKNDWKLNETNLLKIIKKQTKLDSIKQLAGIEKPIYLYIHYFDQLRRRKQIVKAKIIAVFDSEIYGAQRFILKVMENRRIEPNY